LKKKKSFAYKKQVKGGKRNIHRVKLVATICSLMLLAGNHFTGFEFRSRNIQ
jgi:hypothetical protein